MSQREADLSMLKELLEQHTGELSETELEAFADMRFDLQAYGGMEIPSKPKFQTLTDKQRQWVTQVHERIVPQYANLVSRGLVPRGREVPTPPVLQNLPKDPPYRRKRKDDE
jgi:hypothetical protein